MILNGNNYLSLATQSGISFELNLSIDNLSGNCNLGFSGWTEENLNFNFNKGNIFDPNNRIVYSYQNDEFIKISGNIDTGLYSYYINSSPICLNGNTNLITGINAFYINTNNCNADLSISIYGKRPNYSIKTSNFYIDPNSLIKADINNSGNLPFVIYSGVVILPTGFYVDQLTSLVNETGFLTINHINQTANQSEEERAYEVELDLYTNFGKITQIFTTTGLYSGLFTLELDFLNSIVFNNTNIVGSERTGELSFYIESSSGNSKIIPVQFEKNINIDFEYYGGTTGKILFDLPVQSYRNLNINSFISGSGYINTLINFTGSGFHAISGLNVSGSTSGYISDQIILTGFTNKSFNIVSTGYYYDQQFIFNKDYNLNRFTNNGIVDYNSHVSKNDYNWFYSLTGNNSVLFGNTIEGNSGTMVLIGDPNRPNINSTGLVYIFTGDGKIWNIYHIYSGLNGDRNFGKSISVNDSGNRICIASDYGNEVTNGIIKSYSGRAYIITSIGQSLETCKTFSGNGYFGNATAIDEGKIIVIGSYYDNSGLGSIDIYKNEQYFSRNQELYPVEPGTSHLLRQVSTNKSGNVVVSAGTSFNSTTGSGSAWIFTGNKNNLIYAAKLTGDKHYFGNTKVAVNSSGNIIYVGGCCEQFDTNNLGMGGIWIFTGSGNQWIQKAKITGEGSGDGFGITFSINSGGDLLAVGGQGGSSINKSGTIWTFTGNGNQWIYSQKITNSGLPFVNLNSIADFGNVISLSKSGNVLITSSPSEANLAGAIYIFTGGKNNFQFSKKLFGYSSYDTFGSAIDSDFNGNNIIVGAPRPFGDAKAGKVIIVTGNGSNWYYYYTNGGLNSLRGDDSDEYYTSFGLSVSINDENDKLVVGGSQYEEPPSNSGDGAIWLFAKDQDFWTLSGRLRAESNSWIGSYIKIDGYGNAVVASKQLPDQNNNPYSGSIWMMNLGGGSDWEHKAHITGNKYLTGHRFGYSLDINSQGNLILVGAPTLNNTGYAYIITGRDNYSIMNSLNETGLNNYNLFGNSVSLSKFGDVGAIGSPRIDNNKGKVFLYSGNTFQNDWILNSIITGVNNQSLFGNFIRLNDSGDSLFVSAPGENTGAGAVYFYTGNLQNKMWPNQFTYKINKNNINNSPLYASEQFGRTFDFKRINNKDILYIGCELFNTVQILNLMPFSGYIESYIASGIINITNNFLITGSLTGLEYQKTFLDTFNILTGYYDDINGFITGIKDFKINNYISGSRYSKKSLLGSGINNYYIQIKTKNFYDDYKMTGLLTLSGSNISGNKSSVIYAYITGEK
jgi:hypothetical protein